MGDPHDVTRQIWHNYQQRVTQPADRHCCDLLVAEGFFTGTEAIVDVAAGPSPHVAWNLYSRLDEREVFVTDWRADWLSIHKELYWTMKAEEPSLSRLREYWLLCDVQREQYVLTGKAAIVHGVLPRLRSNDRLVLPFTLEDMTATLAGILDAQPARLALFMARDHPEYPESPSRVLPALDRLGVRYEYHENVASADFHPQPGGYLVLLTP